MQNHIQEPAKKINIRDSYDVIVVGGGIGGVAAAVAAARNDASVCIIEKSGAMGGLATLGNVIGYLAICDGHGRKVMSGIAEELLKLSVKDGWEEIPACWREGGDKNERKNTRYQVGFNPASLMLELEKLLVDEGVKILYDCRFCTVAKDGDRIEAVIVESKSGREAIACKQVIDGTGDADVCHEAGEQTKSLDTNARAAWFFAYDGKDFRIRGCHEPFDPYCKPGPGGRYRGDDVESVTQHILDSREKLVRPKLRELNEQAEDHTVYAATLPLMANLRMTRRLVGAHEMRRDDADKVFDDSVGLTGNWRKPDSVWCFPYRSIIGVKNANLSAIGRCMSADETIWDITRVIPCCAVTGEAAGTAAALCCKKDAPQLASLDITALQDQLQKQDMIL